MTAAALLDRLAEAGVGVRLAGDRLALSGPIPVELLAAARENKAELIELLRRRNCHGCGAPPRAGEVGGVDLAGWRCTHCLRAAGMLITGCSS